MIRRTPEELSQVATSAHRRRGLRPLGAALSLAVIFVAVLSIPLRTASELGLTAAETASWITAVYGVAGALGLILVLRYRQPLLLTGNVFVLIFLARLGTDISWPELIGASIVAGAAVLVMSWLGLTHKLTLWLPAPIVFGLLSGAVLPFVVDMFTELGREPLIVGGTLLAYLLARRTLEPRIPAILPALVTGLLLAGLSGEFSGVPIELVSPVPAVTAPVFTLGAILTVAPVMTVLITVQANVPSMVFLREQGYRPPEDVIDAVGGLGTMAGSLLGPTGVSLSLPATALCAGPEAGEHAIRHWAAYVASAISIGIGLAAGYAAQLAAIVPDSLLAAMVGLAVIGILIPALGNVTRGPLTWGPVFAFAVALSDLSLLGLGSFFWAIAGGLGVSLLLEREQWKKLRADQGD